MKTTYYFFFINNPNRMLIPVFSVPAGFRAEDAVH